MPPLTLKQYLCGIHAEGKAAQESVRTNWKKDIAFAKGNQLDQGRAEYKTPFVLNILRKIIDRKAAWLTDSRPTISVVDRTGQMETIANVLTRIIEAIFDERSIQDLWRYFWQRTGQYGSDFISTVYDPMLDHGLGDIDLQLPPSPEFITFDPSILRSSELNKAHYIVGEHVVGMGEMRRRYGNIALLVPASPQVSTYPPHEQQKSFSLFNTFKFSSSSPRSTPVVPRNIVKIFSLKDYSINDTDEPMWMGSPTNGYFAKPRELLYPRGRKIHMVGDGEKGVILSDTPNPYWDGGWQYDMINWYTEVDTAWGTSEVTELKQMQRIFNKVGGLLVDIALYMANPCWIGDEDALSPTEWEKLDSSPAQKIKLQKPGSKFERDRGVPIDPTLVGFWEVIQRAIEYKSEMTEAAQGSLPPGTKSGYMLDLLQTNVLVTIRAMARSYESFLQRVGQKMISRIFQYWIPNRLLRYHDENSPLFALFLNEADEAEQFMIELDRFKRSYPGGKIREAFRDYKFVVKPGSSLAATKMERLAIAERALNARGFTVDGREGTGITIEEYQAVVRPILGLKNQPDKPPGGQGQGIQGPGQGPSSGIIQVPTTIGKK